MVVIIDTPRIKILSEKSPPPKKKNSSPPQAPLLETRGNPKGTGGATGQDRTTRTEANEVKENTIKTRVLLLRIFASKKLTKKLTN